LISGTRTRAERLGRIVLLVALLLVLAGAIVTAILVRHADPWLRQRAIQLLQEKFHSDVDLKEFHVGVFPDIRVEGAGLQLRHEGRTDVPPLISIDSFHADMSLSALWQKKPWRVEHIRLNRLVIQVPPRGERRPGPWSGERDIAILVNELTAEDCQLILLPKSANKEPNVFDIHHLDMRSVGLHRPASFNAQLTNAVPPGEIDTKGSFGPWNPDDPGQTPLGADYIFSNANLDVFKGIGGILSSTGKFGGVLSELEVEGKTSTPDFQVDIAGHRVDLQTIFNATVDGTNGNTILHPVKAHFLHTDLTAKGGVVKVPGQNGRTIALDVSISGGRLEDLMQLAVKSAQPPLTGRMDLHTKLEIPPGKRDIAEKLKLKGAFYVTNGAFTNPEVRAKIASLSRRGLGRPQEQDAGSSISSLSGNFALNSGTASFEKLTFSVPGARIELAGSFGLENEQLDFHGTLHLQAKISQTTTGIKSLLLKPVDPFFRKNGETQIPIKVTGTREHPQFGLELRRKQKKEEGE
jgi:hypothetical protein